MTPFRRSRLRLRLTAASFLLSLLIVSGSVVALVAVLRDEAARTIAARLDDRATALAATVVDQRGRVDVIGADEALFDGPNWVFDATGAQLEGTTSNGSLAPALRSLAATRAARDVTAGAWHLRALPVAGRSGTIAVVVTGVDGGPYSATLDSIVRAAVLLGLLAVIGATGLAALVLSRSLGPIAVMTDQAAGWSRARSDGRFALGPPEDEIGQLAAVLDDLLDRVDAALETERRLTAEIAHELRTPLTLLTGEAQLALMDPATPPDPRRRFERIELAAQGMARAVTTLLADATAHAERDAVADVRGVAERLLPTLDFAGTIDIDGTAPPVAVPSATVERMLAPVLGNAASMGASTITVHLAADGAAVTIRVLDDGPGVDRAVQDTLFTAGVSGRVGGTGLGLPLARRLARDAGGDVVLVRPRPAVFELRLPALDPVDVR